MLWDGLGLYELLKLSNLFKMFKESSSSTVRRVKTPNGKVPVDQVFGYATIPRSFLGNRSPGPVSPSSAYVYSYNNTVGRRSNGGVVGFGNRVEVIDGLVMNRFQKPSQKIYSGTSDVMRSDFYRNPPGSFSVPSSPHIPRSPGYAYNNDDSFESEADVPPYYEMSYNNSYGSQYPPAVPENPPPTSRKPPPENKPSLLLTREENQIIYDILGKGRQVRSKIRKVTHFHNKTSCFTCNFRHWRPL